MAAKVPGAVKVTAAALALGVGLGAWGNSAVNGGGDKKLGVAYELEVNEGATGQGFDAKRFKTEKVKPVSPSLIAFALNSMVRNAGEDPNGKDTGHKMRAAAACTLLLAAGQPMSDEARVAWGSATSTEDLDQDGANEKADGFYEQAEAACGKPLFDLATAGKIGELAIPVAVAED